MDRFASPAGPARFPLSNQQVRRTVMGMQQSVPMVFVDLPADPFRAVGGCRRGAPHGRGDGRGGADLTGGDPVPAAEAGPHGAHAGVGVGVSSELVSRADRRQPPAQSRGLVLPLQVGEVAGDGGG